MSATIGVVIPGHNFRRNLEWTLAALAPQIEAGDEVIAVDDHSTEPLPDRMAKATPWLRIVHREASGGPGNRSAARNAGWRASRGEIIAFLDADMVPSPGFLHALRGLHARHPRIVVKAPRHSLPPRKQRLGKTHCLDLIASADRWAPGPGAPNGDGAGECRPTGKWYLAASNALSVRRRHVVRIGGWDEGFHGWGEEDMDFAYRLHRIGLSFVFPPSRLLYAVHLDHPVAADQAESLRRNALRFVSKFPEVYPVRLPAYNACGISLTAHGAKGPDGDPFRGDSAGEGGEARQSPASLPYALPYAESQESGPPLWGPPPLDYVYHEPPDWDPAALDYVYHEPPERPGWGEWQTEMTQRMGGVFDAGEGAAARVFGEAETFEEHRREPADRLSLVPLVWIVVSVLIGVLVSGSWLRRAITGCVLASPAAYAVVCFYAYGLLKRRLEPEERNGVLLFYAVLPAALLLLAAVALAGDYAWAALPEVAIPVGFVYAVGKALITGLAALFAWNVTLRPLAYRMAWDLPFLPPPDPFADYAWDRRSVVFLVVAWLGPAVCLFCPSVVVALLLLPLQAGLAALALARLVGWRRFAGTR